MLSVELTPRSGVEQVTRAWHAARHAARAAPGGSLQTRACALCIRAADSFAYDLHRKQTFSVGGFLKVLAEAVVRRFGKLGVSANVFFTAAALERVACYKSNALL